MELWNPNVMTLKKLASMIYAFGMRPCDTEPWRAVLEGRPPAVNSLSGGGWLPTELRARYSTEVRCRGAELAGWMRQHPDEMLEFAARDPRATYFEVASQAGLVQV
jgi:hypothetical protein